MLIEATKNKLKELKLEAMIEAWEAHSGNPQMQGLSFDERLGMLVDAQHLSVHNKRIHRARKEAKLRLHTATMEGIEPSSGRPPEGGPRGDGKSGAPCQMSPGLAQPVTLRTLLLRSR